MNAAYCKDELSVLTLNGTTSYFLNGKCFTFKSKYNKKLLKFVNSFAMNCSRKHALNKVYSSKMQIFVNSTV